MAKDAKPAATDGETPPKKSKKLLIIILIFVFLLLLAGAGVAFLLLTNNSDEHADEEEVATAAVKKEKKKADPHAVPVFVNLDAFTVNLVPEAEQGDQYMQVVMALELDDMEVDAHIKAQMPRIRNNLTLILSSKKASELMGKEGKEKLAEEIKNEVNTILEPPAKGAAPEGPVKSVLFTSFIIQ